MSEEHSLEQLFEMQRQMDKKLIKIQQTTPLLAEKTPSPHEATQEPVYDLYRIGDVLHIELELPGVEEQDILVDLTPTYLKVSGTIAPLQTKEKADFLVEKRPRGTFEYILNLPASHMTTQVPPKLKNGVLILHLHSAGSSEKPPQH